jgi:hypothetical protein
MRIHSHAHAVRTEMESSDALLERRLAARPRCLERSSVGLKGQATEPRPILQSRDCKVAASDRRANVTEMACSEAARVLRASSMALSGYAGDRDDTNGPSSFWICVSRKLLCRLCFETVKTYSKICFYGAGLILVLFVFCNVYLSRSEPLATQDIGPSSYDDVADEGPFASISRTCRSPPGPPAAAFAVRVFVSNSYDTTRGKEATSSGPLSKRM